jgi:hypothetical protein
MKAWYEEEDRVLGHPCDPYHRVHTRESSRHVRAALGGETVADTDRPRLVFETGLPTAIVLPWMPGWTCTRRARPGPSAPTRGRRPTYGERLKRPATQWSNGLLKRTR